MALDILYKGHTVEHYDIPWAYGDEAREQAQEVARRCQALEEADRPLNTGTVIWTWPSSLEAS